jgi:hypothetical protein
MNIYFLVEGRRTEKKVYPKWLSHLLPTLIEVDDPFSITTNNFYVFNGNGFPSLLNNHLVNAVSDVNMIKGFNYLVLCLDADEETVLNRKNEVSEFIKANKLTIKNGKFVIIVQNKCIETWFLGNRKAYSRKPQSSELRKYINFYNVRSNDPELMSKMENFHTCAQFHEVYLSEMLLEKNIRYTKRNPNGVIEKHYLEELIDRQEKTNHLVTFKDFIDFCNVVRGLMK